MLAFLNVGGNAGRARCDVVTKKWYAPAYSLSAVVPLRKGYSPFDFDTIRSLPTATDRLMMCLSRVVVVFFRAVLICETPVLPSYECGIRPPPMRGYQVPIDEADEFDVATVSEDN